MGRCECRFGLGVYRAVRPSRRWYCFLRFICLSWTSGLSDCAPSEWIPLVKRQLRYWRALSLYHRCRFLWVLRLTVAFGSNDRNRCHDRKRCSFRLGIFKADCARRTPEACPAFHERTTSHSETGARVVSFERSHLSFHAGGNTRDIERKPKLVFFQYRYDRLLAPFLLLHTREQVACLSLFFDITVVRHDCDYQQICDTYEPELVMFESGVPFEGCERPSVRNIGACTKVPKIGFLHADGFGEGRTGFLSDMDHWGVETFFTIATTAAEHTPAIAQNLFVWPNFVNPDVYRDYRLKKDVEVLFTGNKNTLYPWRQKMVGIIPKHFPSLLCSHPGYNSTKAAEKIVMGETYARLLNSAWLVPACGTVAKEIVRKHFEIPACKSCLVSEKSPGLESAGFVDMKNCVFADEHDVIEKLGYLLENRGELQAIIDAGHELVHSRHTMKQRDQVLQWLRLHQRLAPNQKIVQRNAFEPMKVVNDVEATESIHVRSEGGLASLMREGNQLLWDGAIEAAEKKYLQCVAHYRF